jgi:hypothetical protein
MKRAVCNPRSTSHAASWSEYGPGLGTDHARGRRGCGSDADAEKNSTQSRLTERHEVVVDVHVDVPHCADLGPERCSALLNRVTLFEDALE